MLTFIFRFVLCLSISKALWELAKTYDENWGPIGLVASSVFWGISFAKYLVEIPSVAKYWGKYSAHYEWQGKYYVFDGHHIRFFLVDEVIWVPVADMRPLITPAISERELRLLATDHQVIKEIGEPGLSETGLLRLLETRTEHRRAAYPMVRLKRWLLNQALPNVKRMPSSSANA